MNKLLIVCGPTATGKTRLAIELAKKFNGELVNADSRQVYKGLDALTGKDRSNDVPIHLYDVVDQKDEYSVAHFVRLAEGSIGDIRKRKKLPIVVGGTGFYLRALTRTVETISIPPSDELRKRLSVAPLDMLQSELQRVDPDRWNKMNNSDQKNPRRLIRAIEVAAAVAVPYTQAEQDVLWIGLFATSLVLKDRIVKRVALRFDQAAKEVKEGLPQILGTGPLLSHKRGEKTKDEAMRDWTQAEYAYAKRQMTWFLKEENINWFNTGDKDLTKKVEERVLQWYTVSET